MWIGLTYHLLRLKIKKMEPWSHKIIYIIIANSTKPAIVFIMHQCAQFLHIPKLSHEIGIKCIAPCVTGTRTKGLIVVPMRDNPVLDIYANTNFASLIWSEDV